MSRDYLPTSDKEFDRWQRNYTQLVVQSPGTYGLDQSYAQALAPHSQDFHEKLVLANRPETRTSVAIVNKNAALVALKDFVRIGVGICQATKSVTVEAKKSIEIPIHSTSLTRIKAPTTYPRISATPVGPRMSLIMVRDSELSASPGKPYGAIGMALFAKSAAVGDDPITDPNHLEFLGMMTRSQMRQAWPASQTGRTMYMAGTWITRTGKRGPWGPIASTGIAA